MQGHITRNSSIRMATFSQHHMDGLELHLTPLQYFARVFLNEKEEKLRSHLANFGIAGELAQQAMYTLSGGQKSRVAFAKVRTDRRISAPGCDANANMLGDWVTMRCIGIHACCHIVISSMSTRVAKPLLALDAVEQVFFEKQSAVTLHALALL